MKIKINDKTIEIDTASSKSLKDALETIVTAKIPGDYLIQRVLLNGADLTEKQMSDMASIGIEEVNELEIFTATQKEISMDSIEMASGQLTDVLNETKKTAECFRYKDESEANRMFANLIEVFQKFVTLMDMIKKSLGLDFSTITTDGKTLEEMQESMIDILRQMLTAQQNKDWIALADLLEYEMSPVIIAWTKILPTLACPTNGKPN